MSPNLIVSLQIKFNSSLPVAKGIYFSDGALQLKFTFET